MKNVSLIGIDLAKNVFQLHAVDETGRCLWKRKLSRTKLMELILNTPPCLIAMEACGGAHHLARKFKEYGHEVKLIAPQYVKPFVQGNKNDEADAAAICEAVRRPGMNFVPIKEVWQQDLQAIHRIRQRLIRQRTALMNEARGFLYEYGIIFAQGTSAWENCMKALLSDEKIEITQQAKCLFEELYSEWLRINESIQRNEQRLSELAEKSSDAKRLTKVGGFGLITITALLIDLADPRQFKNGRHFSAWIGLVPRHTGTGGKNRILGISRRGNNYLRSLLVHGARAKLQSVIRKSAKEDKLDSLEQWIFRLYTTKGWNKTAVALANKNARIAWALIHSKGNFNTNKAASVIN